MKIPNVFNALLTQALGPQSDEVPGTWTVCIPDNYGNVQRYDTTSLVQAEAVLNDWLLAGWPAWIEDDSARLVHSIGTRPTALN